MLTFDSSALLIVCNVEAFAPVNNHAGEIRSSLSTSQLSASLVTSQLAALGNNANERVSW